MSLVVTFLVTLAVGDIQWEKSFETAKQTATETNRPIVLLFGVSSGGVSC